MRTEPEDAAYHDGRAAGWQAAEKYFENTLEAARDACTQRAADLTAAQERLAELQESRDTWMDLAVERDQKLAASQERVDFLEAALEAKSQSYEEDMTALEEQLAEMREAADELQGIIFAWLAAEDGYDEGLIESCAYRLRNAVNAAPAGQVLWRIQGKAFHTYLYTDESLPVTMVAVPEGEFVVAHNHEGKDGRSVAIAIREATPEAEHGGQ